MVVDQNQPGPVLPSKWAKPNNSAHLSVFSVNSGGLHGPHPIIWPFTLWALAFFTPQFHFLFISNNRPTSQMDPSCQVIVSGSLLSGSYSSDFNIPVNSNQYLNQYTL